MLCTKRESNQISDESSNYAIKFFTLHIYIRKYAQILSKLFFKIAVIKMKAQFVCLYKYVVVFVCMHFAILGRFKMSPYQTFTVVFQKWLKKFSKLIGYDILDIHFKISIMTISTVMVVCSIIVFCIYTILAHDTESALKCSSIMSVGVQVNLLFV